jgi:hypothetical protein
LREELPFEYQDEGRIKNSEMLMKSWYIENPISKDLVKSMTFRISPACEKEFIIVMKAPIDRVQYNMASFLTLSLVEHDYHLARLVEKRLKHGSEDELEEIEVEAKAVGGRLPCQTMKVMIIGKLENPKIECLRQLNEDTTRCNIISLGVKKGITQQKFRIPFKNLSTALDAEFDFSFVKAEASPAPDTPDEDLDDLSHLFELYC